MAASSFSTAALARAGQGAQPLPGGLLARAQAAFRLPEWLARTAWLWAALLAAVLLCAEGPGSIEDVIFERRFGCAAGFAALGGRVRVEGRTLYAEPGGTLQGTVLEAPDLRGGAALVIAALAAQGSSRITHTEFIDRGYADFAQKLTALGGQIARETPRGADCPKKRTSKTVSYTHLTLPTNSRV